MFGAVHLVHGLKALLLVGVGVPVVIAVALRERQFGFVACLLGIIGLPALGCWALLRLKRQWLRVVVALIAMGAVPVLGWLAYLSWARGLGR